MHFCRTFLRGCAPALAATLLLLSRPGSADPLGELQQNRTLAPPVQGAYVASRGETSLNPFGLTYSNILGWRERIYRDTSDWLGYNFIGIELLANIRPFEFDIGSRMIVQPTSYASFALAYQRIYFPGGLLSYAGGQEWDENRIFEEFDWEQASWGDAFTFRTSLHKEIGPLQGHIQGEWSRIALDDLRDSLYLPSREIVTHARDDIGEFEVSGGYRFLAPFLLAVGVSNTSAWSFDHEIYRSHSDVWFQVWPYSGENSEYYWRYLSLRGQIGAWTANPQKRWEPRFEVALAWERNLF